MSINYKDENELFHRLSFLAHIGWWKADFTTRQYTCSEYVSQLLGLNADISFDDFNKAIREDYRNDVNSELMAAVSVKMYECVFPMNTPKGNVWVRLQMNAKECDANGHQTAFGVIQEVEAPVEAEVRAGKLSRSQRFDSLLHHMPLGYLRLSVLRDKDETVIDFKFKDSNDLFFEQINRPYSFLQNKKVSQIYKKFLLRKEEVIQVLKQGSSQEFEEYNERTGKTYHVIIYSFDPEELIVLLLDITETVEINRALDRSENLFKTFFDNIPIGLEIYAPNGEMLDINAKDMEIFGIHAKEDVLGISLFKNPNLQPGIIKRIREEDKVDFWLDYNFGKTPGYYSSHKRGKMDAYTQISKVYGKNGKLLCYSSINIDNTERIANLNRIKDFENFFLLISNHAKVGYAKYNLLGGDGYAIKQWFINLGEQGEASLTDVIERYKNLHPHDREDFVGFLQKVRSGESRNYHAEMRVRCLDALRKWKWIYMVVVVNLYDPAHGVIDITSVNYDITELKEKEILLKEAKEKAETADRLKSAFLANISHEIRTPLNAIVGFSSLLPECKDQDEQKEYQHIIEKNSDLLLQLITDIVDLAKVESGTLDIQYEETDVNRLCEDVIRVQSMKTPKDLKIIFAPCQAECKIVSDRSRLFQVISKFVNNAIKFTRQGTIEVGYEWQDTKHIRFYVSDTGIGIAKEHQPFVFDRFMKIDSFVHGTGLGLSVCKSIIEQLNGTVGVDSELDKGSCFWFILPVA